MAATITHAQVVAVADDGTSPVGSDEWNAAHTIGAGAIAASNLDAATQGKLVTGGDAHAGRHISTGGDPIAAAVAAGASGLMTGADKTKMDGIASGATANAKATGAEVDTATDDVKFITPYALAVSKQHEVSNAATTDQAWTASQTLLIAGSTLAIPAGKLRVGSVMRWTVGMTKTAAGTVASTFVVQLGTAGTTADADVLTFVLPVVGTGAVDAAWLQILVTCRGPLSSSGKLQGLLTMNTNLAATGFVTVPVTMQAISGSVDVTVANLIASLVLTTAALQVWTVQTCFAELINC